MVTAKRLADKALDALKQTPRILYSELDCQGFVEWCVERIGGIKKDYRGSNDMYRNALTACYPLNSTEGKKALKPGAVLLIVAFDGGENDRYKADGLGNAKHIGIYTGAKEAEVVHSSQTAGGVAKSTLKNAWTHVGYYRGLDYDTDTSTETAQNQPEPYKAIVNASKGETVKLRRSGSRNAIYDYKVPALEEVDVLEWGDEWSKILWRGHPGYMMSAFLESSIPDDDEPPEDEPLYTVVLSYLSAREADELKEVYGHKVVEIKEESWTG